MLVGTFQRKHLEHVANLQSYYYTDCHNTPKYAMPHIGKTRIDNGVLVRNDGKLIATMATFKTRATVMNDQ